MDWLFGLLLLILTLLLGGVLIALVVLGRKERHIQPHGDDASGAVMEQTGEPESAPPFAPGGSAGPIEQERTRESIAPAPHSAPQHRKIPI